jgi:hypothetical protein
MAKVKLFRITSNIPLDCQNYFQQWFWWLLSADIKHAVFAASKNRAFALKG